MRAEWVWGGTDACARRARSVDDRGRPGEPGTAGASVNRSSGLRASGDVKKKRGAGRWLAGARSHHSRYARSPFGRRTVQKRVCAQRPLKEKLSWAGARADCSTRGALGTAGRGTTAGFAVRAAEALGASWIDMLDLPGAVSGPARPKASEPLRCGLRRGGDHRCRGCIVVFGAALSPSRQGLRRRPTTGSACRQPQQRRRAATATWGRQARGKGAKDHRQHLRVWRPPMARVRRNNCSIRAAVLVRPGRALCHIAARRDWRCAAVRVPGVTRASHSVDVVVAAGRYVATRKAGAGIRRPRGSRAG